MGEKGGSQIVYGFEYVLIVCVLRFEMVTLSFFMMCFLTRVSQIIVWVMILWEWGRSTQRHPPNPLPF